MMAEQNMQEFIKVLSSKAAVPAARVHTWRQQAWHWAQWLPI